jgi:hypothetical protein
VTFFHSVPGLAFLHRLVLAFHLVCVEVGACGMRLVCLLVELTGLNRFCRSVVGDAAAGQPSAWRRRSWHTAKKRASGLRDATQSDHADAG